MNCFTILIYNFKEMCFTIFNLRFLYFAVTSIILVYMQTQNAVTSHLSRPPHNLSCYHCSTLTNGESCRSLQLNDTHTQASCKPNQMFCSVILFRYSADSSEYMFWSVERRCEERCQAGCNTVGERVKLFLCRSCCSGYLCNYGNGELQSTLPAKKYIAIATSFALYKYFTFYGSFETLL